MLVGKFGYGGEVGRDFCGCPLGSHVVRESREVVFGELWGGVARVNIHRGRLRERMRRGVWGTHGTRTSMRWVVMKLSMVVIRNVGAATTRS